MRKHYYLAAAAATFAFAAACDENTSPVAPSPMRPDARPLHSSTPTTGAAFTTTNTDVDGTGHCKNGNEAVNCNIYDGKAFVWLNGGPLAAGLADGSYVFAVLAPGGQGGNRNPNDGTPKNLSDVSPSTNTGAGDIWQNRVFTVAGGVIAYAGTHDIDDNKIRLMGYDDTPNSGGVYIMAICSLAGRDASAAQGPGVAPSACKYDAFKVVGTDDEVGPAQALAIDKSADGTNTNTYTWDIAKSVDRTTVHQVGGTATFNYTIVVTRDGGTISDVKVSGIISVFNLNLDENSAIVPVDIDGVTDALSDNTVCTVTDGGAQTLTALETQFSYECSLSALPSSPLDNKATVTWSTQQLANSQELTGGSADITYTGIVFTETLVDDQATITDTFDFLNGGSPVTLGTVPPFDANSTTTKTFTYSKNVAIPATDCRSYTNRAEFTTDDTGAQEHSDVVITVCGPHRTGALTIGFWKGPNGNSLIQNYCAPGTTNLNTYLSGLGAGAGPFAAAAGLSCSQLVTYANGIINAASATDMNKMLKAQMLATALDVYFSSSGWTTVNKGTAKNVIKAPSYFLPNGGIGTFVMDLTTICPMVDNTTTGTASCQAAKPSTNGFASGALPWASQSVSGILTFAATAGVSPWATGAFTSPTWYGTDRTKQEILKNVFDQINNQLAFAP